MKLNKIGAISLTPGALSAMCGMLTGCLGTNVCGTEMVEEDGLCVLPPDSDTGAAGDGTDSSPDADAGDSESVDLPGGMNDPCTADEDCLGEADYCLLVNWPDDLNGICTLQDCNLEVDDCPAGYECLDLAALAPIPMQLPTACSPVSTAKLSIIADEGNVK